MHIQKQPTASTASWNDSICIIPARGGSKGLQFKNVLPLCGQPLLTWNIVTALEVFGSGNVFVTTDDIEIAAIAHRYGAEVIDRPAELADDKASSESALIHALESIKITRKELPNYFLFLQCTSPLTTAADIRAVIKLMESGAADTVLSTTPSHRFLWRDGDAGAIGINHDPHIRLRRQDREPEFAENGAIYAMRTDGFLQHRHRFFGRTAMYVMPEERSWEIDSLVDFKIAAVLMRERLNKELR